MSQQLPAPPFANLPELPIEALIEQVLARNPSLPQMIAAWQAAAARYPQVTSLQDPMFGVTLAPDAIGHLGDGNRGYRLELSQKYPWCGKLRLRGENALAEASAAENEVEDTRLRLIESAQDAFYEYYLIARALEVSEESLRLLREFRQNAATRYKTGMVPEQDVLQADVEIGRQQERQVTLERMREVAIARIDTLLDLSPDAPVPPPPKEIKLGDALPEAQALRTAALARRPGWHAIHLAFQAALVPAPIGPDQHSFAVSGAPLQTALDQVIFGLGVERKNSPARCSIPSASTGGTLGRADRSEDQQPS